MSQLEIEVIAPIPEGWGLCSTCEAVISQADLLQSPNDRSQEAFPPEWMDEYRQLSTVIQNLSRQYGNQILIKLYDPRSLQGMIKSLRHKAFRYPAFIIGGRQMVTGLDINQIGELIQIAGCSKTAATP